MGTIATLFTVAATTTLVTTSASAAYFIGWTTSSTLNANGDRVHSLNANFSGPGLTFVQCGGHEDRAGYMGAKHHDLFTDRETGIFGTWAPVGTNATFASTDSYVTATGSYGGAMNDTILNGHFNDAVGDQISFHAGWIDGNEATINIMPSTYKVAQIVRADDAGSYRGFLQIYYRITGTSHIRIAGAEYTLTPAPNALALLGLSQVLFRRRRD